MVISTDYRDLTNERCFEQAVRAGVRAAHRKSDRKGYMVTPEEKRRLAHTPPAWMYEFDLGDGVKTPLVLDELRSIHDTRTKLIRPAIQQLFPTGLVGKTCLDVACNEGYFSHLLYELGGNVTGIDVREENIVRAQKVQEILGYSSSRLRFEHRDLFDLDQQEDCFDLVLFLGILYHLENPMGAMRLLHKLTTRALILETQLSRQTEPILSGWGQEGINLELEASMGLYQQTDMETNRLAAVKSLCFIPNPAAVTMMLSASGFRDISRLPIPEGMNRQYVLNDRAVFVARTATG